MNKFISLAPVSRRALLQQIHILHTRKIFIKGHNFMRMFKEIQRLRGQAVNNKLETKPEIG